MRCVEPTRAILAAALALAACSGGPDLSPRPGAIAPDWADPAAETAVIIHGERFAPQVSQDLGGASGDRADAGFSAWLGGVALVDVRWLDARTLSAVVPAGLTPGLKELLVRDPSGRQGGLAGAFLVGVPAQLTASLSATPAVASLGQEITLTLTVENSGGGEAVEVVPTAPVAAGAGALGPLLGPLPPGPTSIPVGGSATFRWTGTAVAAGAVSFSTGASGRDGASGLAVEAQPAPSNEILLQVPAALTAVLSLPPAITAGFFTATLTVHNGGEATAVGVRAAGLSTAAGTTALAGPVAGTGQTVDIPGGETRSLDSTWGTTSGSLAISGRAEGTDANSGVTVASGQALSETVTVSTLGTPVEVSLLAVDAVDDGSPVAFVNAWQGRLLLGPGSGGARASACDADGSDEAEVAFALPRDTSSPGSTSRNGLASAPPYPSLGAAGCSATSLAACGPDLEDTRGVFRVQPAGGSEWLVAGPARSGGDLRYLYATPDGGSPLAFRYVDLSKVIGSEAVALTAVGAAGGELYLGFGGGGGQLLRLESLPGAEGLDANAGNDLTDLDLAAMPGVGGEGTPPNGAAVVVVDVVEEFQGRIYVANNGGFARSTDSPPGPGDWAVCTPSAAAWAAKASVTVASAANLTPRDRAVPAVASWNGRLLALRNTTAGPQLWSCNPDLAGDDDACDPGDWTLAAPNTSGDALLTQANDPGNSHATLLVATGAWLYLGLENAAGVQLYRTATATPVNISDFHGRGGCQAGAAGCQGFGGEGLGTPELATRFWDAKALVLGGTTGLYFTAGNGVDPARLYRVLD